MDPARRAWVLTTFLTIVCHDCTQKRSSCTLHPLGILDRMRYFSAFVLEKELAVYRRKRRS